MEVEGEPRLDDRNDFVGRVRDGESDVLMACHSVCMNCFFFVWFVRRMQLLGI